MLFNFCCCRLLKLSKLHTSCIILHSTTRNFYDVLEISPKATHAEIKAAYFRQTKKHHPDVSDRPDSATNFRELTEAYDTLRNPDKRRLYDRRFVRSEMPSDSVSASQSSSRTQFDEEAVFRPKHGTFRPRSCAPPTGSWKHYNFDEHYRGHYGEHTQQRRSEESLRRIYMDIFSKGGQQTPEELRGLRDFLLQYNRIAERCFQICASDFNQRALTPDEETCVDQCCSKYINTTRRLMTVFWETQADRVAKKQAEEQALQQAASVDIAPVSDNTPKP